MITIAPIKSLSTALLVIFAENFVPSRPPLIPPMIIRMRIIGSKGGILPDMDVKIRLVIWEKKMTKIEFNAAVLLSIEKKKQRTARFIGPPPIPRKVASPPSIKPIKTVKRRLSLCRGVILSL